MKQRDLKINFRGEDVRVLHNRLEQLGFSLPEKELERAAYGPGTRAAVEKFQRENNLEASGVVDSATQAALTRAASANGSATYTVQGRVANPQRGGVSGLRVQIMDVSIGRLAPLAQATTDASGAYTASFSQALVRRLRKDNPDLQAVVFQDQAQLGSSDIHYNAAFYEVLNVLIPESAAGLLHSEHETLTSELAKHFSGRLGSVQENSERKDITYLANKTGWDARAVALAALADQFSARTATGKPAGKGQNPTAGSPAVTTSPEAATLDASAPAPAIEPHFFYALFRAGLPANEEALYQTDANLAEQVWKQSIADGILPASAAKTLPRALESFRTLATQRALTGPALAGISTLQDMLNLTLKDNVQAQQTFAALYTQYRAQPAKLWDAVSAQLGQQVAAQLKVDGQLAFLTLNNAPLMQTLRANIKDPLELAAGGYYQVAKWQELLANNVTFPPEIPGDTPEQKRANYASLMAAQVRLSYPTTVLAQQVRSGETPLSSGLNEPVSAFLEQNSGKFEIGMIPVQQYIKRNNLEVAPAVVEQLKSIQRAYQITPNDRAMNGLLGRGIDSAYAVQRYDQAEFVSEFSEALGSTEDAALTYTKATQVYNYALNIATAFLTARYAPQIGSDLTGPVIYSQPDALQPRMQAMVDNSPDLEGLFGSLDFCTCDECRSILSPAAYLVDLLEFIDRPVNLKQNPQDVLFARRPDIPYLPLTCENTNTPQPYIDLVNEILEYYVTHNLTLTNYQGYNTDGSATPEELLASPQFVSDAAYTLLAGEQFPAPLPFHQPLENLRRYFSQFQAPLPQVMAALRKNDAVERPSPDEYAWRDILMETLRLSREEYTLLTESSLTLQQLYGFPTTTSDADTLAAISNVKAYTRRISISYQEIIDILSTKFVNPNSTLIPRLEALTVPFSVLKDLKDGVLSDSDFIALLPPGLNTAPYNDDVVAWVKDPTNYANIMSLITVSGPSDAACSFDQYEFRYADPAQQTSNIRPFEFVRLLRFIRLWKKLGWTIQQTDLVINALYPAADIPNDPNDTVNLQRLDDGFLTLLPRLGVLYQVIDALGLSVKKDLPALLACFGPIDTHGPDSLYRQMFLSQALHQPDAAFADDGFGNFLQDASQKLLNHTETLRAAFLLTADELTWITDALGYDANTGLSIDTISAVFRRGWLARKLKISVREMLLLSQFSGLDPFAAPDPPLPTVVRFIQLAQQLKTALKPVQALYLIWNQDITGKAAQLDKTITDFARTLRNGFAAVENEFALVDDPDGTIARARMVLVYGSDTADFFFGLLNNTFTSETPYNHTQATLEPAILAAAPGRISYDDLRKRLAYSGVMTLTARNALQGVVGVSVDFQNAVGNLYTANQAVVGPFFTRYPELLPLYTAYDTSTDPPPVKRSALLAAFLPELKKQRKREQALQAISAAAHSDLVFAGAVLDNLPVLHSAVDSTQTALADLTALENTGLSASIFYSDTASGSPDESIDEQANLAYAPSGGNPLPVNGNNTANAISGIWAGYLEAPASGFYNLTIEADASATVTLSLGGSVVSLARNANVWSNAAPIQLTAGSLTFITLTVEKVKDNLTVRWETSGRGWEVPPARYLYSAARVKNLRAADTRFLKAATLAQALSLTANETAFLAASADLQISGQGWLNSLPVSSSPDGSTSAGLFKALLALLDFHRIKAALSPDDENLLAILQDPLAAAQPGGLLLTLTQWDGASLSALLARFSLVTSDLAHLANFARVYDAFAWVSLLGIPAAALVQATTNEPDANIVRALQSALRARYDESDWLNVLKLINDEMRSLQRYALVAYILQQLSLNPATAAIDTPDKLFEHFLVDVEMDPCMETSRIRLALSSVQLFVERCLMNLESDVSPASINAKQWAWMKRYRVWEANRKVFLWPENWLEPELRDDQSPFFKEAMNELLQSDITEDSAATALLNYLAKLEEVAKLEPVSLYYAENDPGTADDVAYVVARTSGAHRKYYFRRLESGSWTPWEQIKLDIEDNPVMPVIWKGRLFLFWLRISKQPLLTVQKPGNGDVALTSLTTADIKTDQSVVGLFAVLCYSEFYNGKWQPAKTSDTDRPTSLNYTYSPSNPKGFIRANMWLSAEEDGDTLRIYIQGYGYSWFTLYNSHSLPVRREDLPILIFNPVPKIRYLDAGGDTFTIYYDSNYGMNELQRDLLKSSNSFDATTPRHALQNPWDAPFFFWDSRHVFYVTTAEQIVWIPQWVGYGISPLPKYQLKDIPPFIYKVDPLSLAPAQRAPNVPIGPSPVDPGFTDPAPIRTFVSQDAYINKGLAITTTVNFGGTEIGPVGGIEKNVG